MEAYGSLPGANPPVAVRSSATAEDLPEASFAGQQETYLNIRGADAVLAAVKNCWASLWTGRAIGYRLRQGIAAGERGPGGGGAAAGRRRSRRASCSPPTRSTARRDEMVINAAWGLGEAVVGGVVTPDTLTVDKADGKIIRRETADKQVMTVRTEGGTAEQPVPDGLKNIPVLSDEQAAELARLGMQIEDLYGMPMDIEWALADGEFTIVQARPMTALPEAPHRVDPAQPQGHLHARQRGRPDA